MTYFCGGSRHLAKIIELFDTVFVLDVDRETLLRRLARRPEHEFGGKQAERDFLAGRYRTRADRIRDRRLPEGRS
ncbi:hypothetical protein GCM10028864_15080 [Microlunatus parietis]